MRPPQRTAGPPRPEPPGRPPAAVRGRRQGTRAPYPLPLPPDPRADGGRLGRQQPCTPRGVRCTQRVDTAAAASVAARQAPPVARLHPPALPATGQQRNSGTQEGANGAAHSEAGLGKAGARTRARTSLPPSLPPPATVTHWRPTGPRPTPTAAWQPPQHGYTPGGRPGDKG